MSELLDPSIDSSASMHSQASIHWRILPFDDLTPRELYALLQLRSEIFVVEQACVFQDMDGADLDALHLLGTVDQQLVAYARCFDAGHQFAEASIGRVVTRDSLRGAGAGHLLIFQAIDAVHRHWGVQPIRIGAQQRLEKFYAQHGFVQSGAPYIEDGIPHIAMLRPA